MTTGYKVALGSCSEGCSGSLSGAFPANGWRVYYGLRGRGSPAVPGWGPLAQGGQEEEMVSAPEPYNSV